MKRPTILIFGRNGQVAYELARALSVIAEVVSLGREDIDVDDLSPSISSTVPDLVVNAAAYTAVDRAESEPDDAERLNSRFPARMAELCAERHVRLLHFSTDYVFDGSKRTPYVETDPTAPLGVYGATKLAGERAVLEASPRNLVLRLAWVYGLRGSNFMLTMLRLARADKPLRVVSDQFGAPSWSRSIAEGSAQIAAQLLRDHETPGGLYHLSPEGETSWHGFAEEIFKLHPEFMDKHIEIQPITSAEFPTAAKRPEYSVLDSSRAEADYGVRLPHWRKMLGHALT